MPARSPDKAHRHRARNTRGRDVDAGVEQPRAPTNCGPDQLWARDTPGFVAAAPTSGCGGPSARGPQSEGEEAESPCLDPAQDLLAAAGAGPLRISRVSRPAVNAPSRVSSPNTTDRLRTERAHRAEGESVPRPS